MDKEVYQKMYTLLFNKITDALEQLEKDNFGMAKELLVTAQIEAENYFINDGTPN